MSGKSGCMHVGFWELLKVHIFKRLLNKSSFVQSNHHRHVVFFSLLTKSYASRHTEVETGEDIFGPFFKVC